MQMKGLAYFDCTKKTAYVTDWSKQGIGYVLLQKHCNCIGDVILFCCEGWKMASCSRFLQPSEYNYVRIEGEALTSCHLGTKGMQVVPIGMPKILHIR